MYTLMANTGFATRVNGVVKDLITVFAPLTGTKLTYNTNYVTSAGLDLTDIFEPYLEGDATAVPTKYTTISGGVEKDLNLIFKKFPIYFPTNSNGTSAYGYSAAINNKNVLLGNDSSGGGIWYSSDYGETLVKSRSAVLLNSYGYTSVAISGNNAVACGGKTFSDENNGPFYFFYSTDAGITWSLSNTTLPLVKFGTAYNAMCISGTRAAAVISNGAALYVSTNSGVSYSLVSSSIISGCSYVTMDSTNYYYVVTTKGVYRSGAGFNTATFTQINTLTSSSAASTIITSISADLTNNVVMFSTNTGRVYYSTNNGGSWTNKLVDTNLDVVSVSGTNAIAGKPGNGGIYYISKNTGASWTKYTNALMNSRVNKSIFISGKNIVAADYWSGTILYGEIPIN